MDKYKLDAASSALKAELVRVLGPGLPGVRGYGPGLDSRSQIGLNVIVNTRARDRLQTSLPRSIEGLPVRLALGGMGRLD